MKEYLPYCLIPFAAVNAWADFSRGFAYGGVGWVLVVAVWSWCAWLDHNLRRMKRKIEEAERVEEDEP